MFFKAKAQARSPVELLRATEEALSSLTEANSSDEKLSEEIVRNLQALRLLLLGELDTEVNSETLDLLVAESLKCDFLATLVGHLGLLDWEGRKEIASVWEGLVKDEKRCWQYLEENKAVVDDLVSGYESVVTALASGAMLREALRAPEIARYVLESSALELLFCSSDVANFDVASDAFNTLKELLRRHRQMVAEFLNQEFDRFFALYETLLTSDNYVTRRQALKLLGEMLLDRANVAVMMRFIGDPHNLKLMMTLLKDSSKTIQYEAFHVFKVFVANPNKPEGIKKLLFRNRDKILKFLHDFDSGKDDEDFDEEKDLLKREIEALKL